MNIIMNYKEAIDFVFSDLMILLHDRLEEVYPDMYDVCRVTGDDHHLTNPSMYKYYSLACNALSHLSASPKYKSSRQSVDDYSYVQDMYNDLKNAKCPVRWMVESIPIIN